jgi:hypothetical protein
MLSQKVKIYKVKENSYTIDQLLFDLERQKVEDITQNRVKKRNKWYYCFVC